MAAVVRFAARLGNPIICVVLISLAAFATPCAHACTCPIPPPPREAAAAAAVVFTGAVSKIEEESDAGDGRLTREIKDFLGWAIDDGYWRYAVEFSVSSTIKGKPSEKIVVRTPVNGGSCGYRFQEGVEYLVYTYSHGEKLYTSICMRTTPVRGAEAEIRELLNRPWSKIRHY